MKKFSVILDGVENNKDFCNKIYTEMSDEIGITVNDNEINFQDVNKENIIDLSKYLAKAIITEFEKKILIKIINKNCAYFNNTDKLEIWKRSMEELLNCEYNHSPEYIYRFEIIRSELEKYIIASDRLSLEGFVNFRLKEYMDDLEEVVEFSVQEYLLDLEYKEFINMLKFFVSMQETKYNSIDVYIINNNLVLSANGKDITNECLCEYNKEAKNSESNMDDFLLNSLISLSPITIRIHNKDDISIELRKTLEGVFDNKIKYLDK